MMSYVPDRRPGGRSGADKSRGHRKYPHIGEWRGFSSVLGSLCSRNVTEVAIYQSMMIKRYALACILLLSVAELNAGSSEAGAIFLIIYPGARQNSMGAAFTAISDDALATYYNDAGLGFQEKGGVSLMHANWLPGLFPGMYYEFVSCVYPMARGVVGGHVTYLTTGETIGTDHDGREIGRWTTWDGSVKISYGTRLSKKTAVGVGAKFIRSYLAPHDIVWKVMREPGGGTGSSWAFDVSTLHIPSNRWRVGLSLQNIGPNISYVEAGKSDPLPWTVRCGLAWRVIDQPSSTLMISGELTKIVVGILTDIQDIQKDSGEGFTRLYQDTWKGIGAEYTIANLVAARGGYFCDEAGKRKGITYGGGIKAKGLAFDIGIDSALYDFPTSNYRFSLGYSF
jgi:hypothetical protein